MFLNLLTLAKRGFYFKDWDNFRKALSLMHTVENKYGIWLDLKKYFNNTVDFLNDGMDASQVIACMHQISLLVVGNMGKYWPAESVGVVLSHALRHCARALFACVKHSCGFDYGQL